MTPLSATRHVMDHVLDPGRRMKGGILEQVEVKINWIGCPATTILFVPPRFLFLTPTKVRTISVSSRDSAIRLSF